MSLRQKKKKLDPADYTFEDLVGVTAGKLPGQINGEQFSIENCKVCSHVMSCIFSTSVV